MLCHWWNRFDEHPTVHCLKRYLGNNGSSWHEVAESINTEYRNLLDTLSITLTGLFHFLPHTCLLILFCTSLMLLIIFGFFGFLEFMQYF